MNNYDDIKRFKEKLNMEGIDYKEIAENNPHKSSQNWAILKQVASADEPFHPLEQGLSTQPTPSPVSNKEFSLSALDKPAPLQPVQKEFRPRDLASTPVSPVSSASESGFSSPLMSAVSKILPAAPARDKTAHEEAPASEDIIRGVGNVIEEGFGGPHAPGDPFAAQQHSHGASIFDDLDSRPAGHTPAARQFNAPQQQQPAARASLFDNINRGAPADAPAAREPIASHQQPAAGSSPAYGMRFNKLFSRKSRLPAGTLPGRDMPLSLLLENIALCR